MHILAIISAPLRRTIPLPHNPYTRMSINNLIYLIVALILVIVLLKFLLGVI